MAKESQKKPTLLQLTARRVQRLLLGWFATHRRTLPWRRTRNPYRILVSEIMLQQTQVDRVRPLYRAFLHRFPTLPRLARAHRRSVVHAWAGLGYNNRAVRLHTAVRLVVRRHGGRLPRTFRELHALPGVGAYTARAILSFAFGKRVAAVDVNHSRVVSRVFFGLCTPSRRTLDAMCVSLLPRRNATAWNQMMMDFGALVCRSVPRCAACPLKSICAAYPAILTRQNASRRSAEPFLGSDRYFRGRIVHVLRTSPRTAVSVASLWERVHAIHPILPARHRALVAALVADGLVQYVGNGHRTVRLA